MKKRPTEGVCLDDLQHFECIFKVKFTAFSLVREESRANETGEGEYRVVARLVRRSLCKHKESMNVNLYEALFSYIKNMN